MRIERFLCLVSLLFALSCAQSPGDGGGIVGNGTGEVKNVFEKFSHWLPGPRRDVVARFCIVRSPKFPFKEAELRLLIERAFEKWNTKISALDLRYYVARDQIPNSQVGTWDRDGRYLLSPAIEISYKRGCKKRDGEFLIPFYFGVQPPALSPDKYRKRIAKQEAAGDFYEEYDSKSMYRRGFVWISPPKVVYFREKKIRFRLKWTEPHLLDAALTHEIGHIFGNPELVGTVMDPQIVRKMHPAVLGKMATSPEREVSIDHFRTLSTNPLKSDVWSGQFGKEPEGELRDAFFVRLFGVKPFGRIRAVATHNEIRISDDTERKFPALSLKCGEDTLTGLLVTDSWNGFIITAGRSVRSSYNFAAISSCEISTPLGEILRGRAFSNGPPNQRCNNAPVASPLVIEVDGGSALEQENPFTLLQYPRVLFYADSSPFQSRLLLPPGG